MQQVERRTLEGEWGRKWLSDREGEQHGNMGNTYEQKWLTMQAEVHALIQHHELGGQEQVTSLFSFLFRL